VKEKQKPSSPNARDGGGQIRQTPPQFHWADIGNFDGGRKEGDDATKGDERRTMNAWIIEGHR
jgi:hypothetical protein